MKKIFLGMLLIAFMSAPAIASNDGGKKKTKNKAQTEQKTKNCDPEKCRQKCDKTASNCGKTKCSFACKKGQ